jgi:hypothetical protein
MITGDSFSVKADPITELWLERYRNLHVWEDENYAQNYKNYLKIKFNKKFRRYLSIPVRFCRSMDTGTWAGCSRCWAKTGPAVFLKHENFKPHAFLDCFLKKYIFFA